MVHKLGQHSFPVEHGCLAENRMSDELDIVVAEIVKEKLGGQGEVNFQLTLECMIHPVEKLIVDGWKNERHRVFITGTTLKES